MSNTKGNDETKGSIDSARHSHTYDTSSINQAIDKASKDPSFITNSIQLIKEMHFPAYKKDIVNYVRNASSDSYVIALFESLDGYIEFKDLYQVQKAIEQNNPEKKKTHQITDKTRQSPEVLTRDRTIDKSVKDAEAVNKGEERKDYPEVTPTAMSNFVCNTCGKAFQNQNELLQHQHFEGSR
jgi:hypothetical protein